MNLNYFQYLVEVANIGSISKAAEKNFVSQPYLSGIIKKMEDEVGFLIFKRTNLGIELTEKGEIFINEAKKILIGIENIKNINTKNEEGLSIGMVYSLFFTKCFLKFKKFKPTDLQDKVYEMSPMEIFKALIDNKIRLGLFSYATKKKDKYWNIAKKHHLKCWSIYEDLHPYVIMSRSHPLALNDSITISDLNSNPYVVYDKSEFLIYLDMIGIRKHPDLLLVSDRGSFSDAILDNNYLGITTYFSEINEQDNKFIYIKLEDCDETIGIGYAILDNYKLSQREKDFIKFIKNK
ncbi:LysR family transcriptional regulator [Clostridioides difficile]|uniref:LysR family transcriptional regulator n=3 Tax=Clostridioides difficile TaxID=1496 RepID=A0AAX3GZM1_CLODI|nr:LysR family transcriptional regulator [Clostridioides difficile]AVD39871.1 LysR family transcriptional regulator [Clostridioides difficile]AVD43387.1 LysR family transcriptional regulator [Clostridioides difficile]AXL65816.1 LysR family transcriptional regulator [Clostridioides difficile]AXU70018.1 LysR family transcriptional regulator [Clostridioides difficile]AXU92149.1 LysR family transcriptional regulator [Clostridioides difficile]